MLQTRCQLPHEVINFHLFSLLQQFKQSIPACTHDSISINFAHLDCIMVLVPCEEHGNCPRANICNKTTQKEREVVDWHKDN